MDGVEMFARAAGDAAALARIVTPDQLALPTPCVDWDVAALLAHMAGGPAYLLGALGASDDSSEWPSAESVAAVVDLLREPGALDRRCMSPAGFEWSVGDAAAGSAMDQLIHTWDLAVAVGAPLELDTTVVDAVVATFLPHMPEVGRQAGIVGPAIDSRADASATHRLLAAMGRDPSG